MTAPIRTLASLAEADEQLLRSVGQMSPEQVYEPSALPGWTRGHVLAHLSRNADGMANLLEGARTGRDLPMYAHPGQRENDIAAGAARPLDEHLADLRDSARRFEEAAAAMPDDAWQAQVRHRRGTDPAARLVWRRYAEVEYHHVDLDLDHTPAHWPADFVADQLAELTGRYENLAELPPFLLQDTDSGSSYLLGRSTGDDDPYALPELSGPSAALLAWLVGRSDGSALGVPVADLPRLPPLG